MFMDDDAKSHINHIVKDFFEDKENRNVNVLPSCTDFNLIEHVWDCLERVIAHRNPLQVPGRMYKPRFLETGFVATDIY